jgi:hypothetical protein
MAERSTRGTSVVTSLNRSTGPNLADRGRERRAPASHCGRRTPGRVSTCRPGGHGEVLRDSRGDAAGIKLGSSFAERNRSEHGNRPGLPARVASGVACQSRPWPKRRTPAGCSTRRLADWMGRTRSRALPADTHHPGQRHRLGRRARAARDKPDPGTQVDSDPRSSARWTGVAS